MREWIAVALGGMLGAVLRHGLSSLFSHFGAAWLPAATLCANILGCFAIGYLFSWSFNNQLHNHWLSIGVRVGLLGGLTTFSSFALDVIRVWQDGRPGSSVSLAITHVAVGIMAVVVGMACAGAFHTPESRQLT